MSLTPSRRQLLALSAAAGILPRSVWAQDDTRLKEMVLGSADAELELVEYASFTCPHCAAFHNEMLPRLKKDYIETGKLRMVMREFFRNRYDLWTAMVARCDGASRYFGIVDEVFRTQADLYVSNDDVATTNNLRALGRLANLPAETLQGCLSDQELANSLVELQRTHQREHVVEATPTFFLDGVRMELRSFDDFWGALDAKLN